MTTPTNAPQALALLAELGAPSHLVRHHELVAEAAEILIRKLRRSFRVQFDAQQVMVGAALHDAGKIKHPNEMSVAGHAHERDGEAMLLAHGVAAHVARFCWTHAAWTQPDMQLEDLLVAAADKLWKGKREADLEQRLVEALAASSGLPAWEAFSRADEVFAEVAANGDERLERSRG